MTSQLSLTRRELSRKRRKKKERMLEKLKKRYKPRRGGKLRASWQASKHETRSYLGVKRLLGEDGTGEEEDEERESMAEEEQESPLILDEVFPMKTLKTSSSAA